MDSRCCRGKGELGSKVLSVCVHQERTSIIIRYDKNLKAKGNNDRHIINEKLYQTGDVNNVIAGVLHACFEKISHILVLGMQIT